MFSDCIEPRSQVLSSLPPLVVGRKTLIVAGHMTTKNKAGKKIYWSGGVTKCFVCCCDKLCGFQNLELSLKATRSISAVFKIKKTRLQRQRQRQRRGRLGTSLTRWLGLRHYHIKLVTSKQHTLQSGMGIGNLTWGLRVEYQI